MTTYLDPRPRLLTGPVVRLFGVEFAALSSFFLLLSVVPLFSDDRGLGSVGGGLSTAVLLFAAVAAELTTPGLAVRLGFRRLLVAGLVLLGAPALALPWITGLGALVAVSLVRGVGFAIVVVAVGALAAAVIPAERRGEGLGLLGLMATLPAVLTLPLGVWLVGQSGYGVAFAAAGAVSLGATVLVVGLPGSAETAEEPGGLLAVVRLRAVAFPGLVFAVTAAAAGAVVAFVPTAVGAVAVPALFVQSAAAALTRWLAGRHADRHGAAPLLGPAVVLCALGLGLTAFTFSPAAVLVGMALFGCGFGLAQAASLTTMLQRVPSSRYGAVSAAWNAAYDLGWGAGALGIGLVVNGAGHAVAFATAAVLVLAALPLTRRSRWR